MKGFYLGSLIREKLKRGGEIDQRIIFRSKDEIAKTIWRKRKDSQKAESQKSTSPPLLRGAKAGLAEENMEPNYL